MLIAPGTRSLPILTGVDLSALEELDGLRVGVARAEAYAECEAAIAERRARGLFGDLRFTLTNTARSCHPERLVRGARSVIAVALPLWRPAAEHPDGLVGRMPRYAWRDPYAPLRIRLEALPRGSAASTARARRSSSTRTTTSTARRRSAPASRSPRKNTMAIVPGEGSFVALGAVVTDLELEPAESWCRRAAAAARSASTPARPAPWSSPACSTRARASRTRRSAPRRSPTRTPTRSRTACTAATSARTCARGTPARPLGGPSSSPIPRPGCRSRTGSSCPTYDLLERHGHLYVPQRDARYLRRNALIALGNAGGAEARALAEPFARSGDPVLAAPARRVLDAAEAQRQRLEHGPPDVLVDHRGVDIGDLGPLGEVVDHEGVQRVGVRDRDVQQEVARARHDEDVRRSRQRATQLRNASMICRVGGRIVIDVIACTCRPSASKAIAAW